MRTSITIALILMAGLASATATKSDVADAVMKGDTSALHTLLQQKADINAPQVDGARALHWAVYRGDLDALNQLIQAGATVNVATREGVTPLQMAATYGHAAMIEALLKAGADAKQRGANGETLLMFAARSGNPEAIKLIAGSGVDVNARETLRGTTALMWAVEQRHPAAVKMLGERGADVGAKSGPAGWPRNYMAPRVDTAAVQAAIKRHADAAANGRSYEEQLEWDAEHGAQIRMGFRGTLNGAPSPAGNLARRGPLAPAGAGAAPPAAAAAPPAAAPASRPPAAAPPDDTGDDTDVIVAGLVGTGGGGLTPLIFAAREGDLEATKYLLDGRANVNQTSEYGWTPLLTATNNRHYKLASY